MDKIVNDIDSTFKYEPKQLTKGILLGEIYSTENFAAFTDIAYYNNNWYVVFRAGTAHADNQPGKIKILKSKDATTWKVEKIIATKNIDLRDPKLTIDTFHNDLYLNYFGRNIKDGGVRVNYLVQYNKRTAWNVQPASIDLDGVGQDRFVLWRFTYSRNKMYCAGYRVPLSNSTTNGIGLFESERTFKRFKSVGSVDLGGTPSEATIRFDAEHKMYFIIRTEDTNSPIGISTPPEYVKLKWIPDPLIMRLSSPNFLIYKNKLLITGRDGTTGIFKFLVFDLTTMKVQKIYTFPSGKETGYAGMSFNPDNADEMLISYYSIRDKESVIYLAKVDLKVIIP
ncbi:hypothetical protein [Chitinophaga sp. GbtcB8]|uniref:hypothetical protein n=1 Tax=Chitinophaga sp. GbtcB8 TaxID=2824753 RepID=UPI001C2F118B|nr:hypothetical protein [Chitinophaga sp. GbtcB8]